VKKAGGALSLPGHVGHERKVLVMRTIIMTAALLAAFTSPANAESWCATSPAMECVGKLLLNAKLPVGCDDARGDNKQILAIITLT
jgi:hypothetical protein